MAAKMTIDSHTKPATSMAVARTEPNALTAASVKTGKCVKEAPSLCCCVMLCGVHEADRSVNVKRPGINGGGS